MGFLRVIIIIIIGIFLGILYNKFVIKYFSENKRKLFFIFTILIFILSSISLSIVISIKYGIISSINTYSGKVEQYIYDVNQNNDFIINGIDLNRINYDNSIVTNTVNNFIAIIPTHTDLRINKSIYDMVIGYPINEIINQINSLNDSVNNYTQNLTISISTFADSNNFITVSSILSYLNYIAKKYIDFVFIRIMIILLIPIIIYVLSTSIYIIIKTIKK